MENMFSDRISDVPKSFIREILKAGINKNLISFAGGLPNRELFPIKELKAATDKVFANSIKDALQYSTSEGDIKLREYISSYYRKHKNLEIDVDDILITTGSQQGLDLLGKTFLNEGDDIILEEPGYLGAIQAFSVYKAKFNQVKLNENGMDTIKLKKTLNSIKPKLMYTVPTFQNPSGISYSNKNRRDVADIIKDKNLYLIEDDPYGRLRFSGEFSDSFKKFLPEKTILLGTFSKTIVPGFRIGWLVAPQNVMDRIIVAKQASDLHTNYFCQRIIVEYLTNFNPDDHISKIINVYGRQKDAMINAIEQYFPKEVKYTKPEGGMFLWCELPNGLSSMELFNLAIKKDVAFVPGNPFYPDTDKDRPSFRLNFSCSNEKTIDTGIRKLAEAIKELMTMT